MGTYVAASPPGKGWELETTMPPPKAAAPTDPVRWGPPGKGWEQEAAPPVLEMPTRPVPRGQPLGYSREDDPRIGFLAHLRANLPPDVATKIKRYSQMSGIPENRFGVMDGHIVFHDGEKFVTVTPEITGEPWEKFTRLGETVAAGTPGAAPSVAGLGAGLAMGPTPLSVPVAGAAAATTDVARQFLDRALAGEWGKAFSPGSYDFMSAGKEGLLNMMAQGAGVGLSRALSRNPLAVGAYDQPRITPQALKEWQALHEEGRRRGINLTAGQTTNLPSILATERQLSRLPETTNEMLARLTQQRTVEVPQAIRQELGYIHPFTSMDEAVGAAPRFTPKGAAGEVLPRPGLRGAAKDIMVETAAKRTRAASPFYEEAFNSGAVPDVTPTITYLKNAVSQIAEGHPARTAAQGALKALHKQEPIIEGGKVVGTRSVPQTDYRSLHTVKETMDSILRKIAPDADAAAINRAEKIMAEAQRTLTDTLKATHPQYQRGWETFIEKSAPLTALKEGLIGKLSKSTGMERIAILDDTFARATPAQIKRARAAFYDAGRSDDWNRALRSHLENALDIAMKETRTAQAANVPGAYRQRVWGQPMRERVKAAMDDPARITGFEKLMEVLAAAARSLPEGSPTATDLLAPVSIGAAGKTLRMAGKLTSPATLLTLGDDVVSGIVAMRTPAARRQLAEYLLSGDSLAHLKKMRLLNPRSEKAVRALGDVLVKAGVVGGAEYMGLTRPADFPPPGGPFPGPDIGQ